MNIRALDKKLIKQSTVRLVKCGLVYEKYEYATPYFYNFGSTRSNDSVPEEDTPGAKRRDNIERARRKIKRLINSNAFVYGYKPIFVTYTFRDNVTNMREANATLKAHHDNLRKTIVGRCVRAVVVPELQKRGAIHYHAVYFDLPYITEIKKVFEKSWGAGFVQVKAVEHVINIGAYVSKYFSKQWHTHRTAGSKTYYSSLNLYQPETYHGEEALDIIDGCDTLLVEHKEEFFSEKFGTIKYTQFKQANISTNL